MEKKGVAGLDSPRLAGRDQVRQGRQGLYRWGGFGYVQARRGRHGTARQRTARIVLVRIGIAGKARLVLDG